MPLIRRVGNSIFAFLLSIFASSRVRDTASGMRVVRRSSLAHLLPLPNGLHFTPAMSARAMMSDAVQISELDMPYHERVGESKLHVIRDGLRFLRVIVETGFLYRPSRPLNLAGIVLTLISSVLMFPPAVYYSEHRAVLEWMIYRFLVSHLLGTAACLAFCASFILSQMTEIALADEIGKHKPSAMQRFFHSGWFWVVNAGLTTVGGSLVLASLLQLLETGSTYEHWSRFIAMTFCLTIVTILLITRCTEYVLGLVRERVQYRQNSEKP